MFLLRSEKQDERLAVTPDLEPTSEGGENAAYGCVRTYANLLGDTEARRLLEETLQEEKETDKKLTKLAEKKNVEANELGEGDESSIAGKKSKTAA
jgi:rubrerythrin